MQIVSVIGQGTYLHIACKHGSEIDINNASDDE